MTELLPGVQAPAIRDGITDYLGTTFALADDDARRALGDFLSDPDSGIFKGPYLRVRLPFRPAAEGWRDSLEDWYKGFTPYGHQAQAFARLTSIDLGEHKPRPQPTLVTTGTGSGKTEAFLLPIIDHILRAKRRGEKGTKALILYPMNALANDQAQRLATLLTGQDELAGITAALYTGQQNAQRAKVSKDGLITRRDVIRGDPPDILLTNYKMLDNLLLRAEDAAIWERSARSLRYLVLDEFHTYDGAQGTDLTMLLRRLGLALKAHWPKEAFTPEDRARPLGIITPVATSATLGAKGDPVAMLDFARTVFGDEFTEDSVITESRLSADEWVAAAPPGAEPRSDREAIESAVERAEGLVDGREIAMAVLGGLFDKSENELNGASPEKLLALARAHPLTRALVEHGDQARPLAEVVDAVLPALATDSPARLTAEQFLLLFSAALSHIRSVAGREALSIDLHLWVRELTRIDRVAVGSPRYLWSDDGHVTDDLEGGDGEGAPAFPAVYCRHCGRSGWGVLRAPIGGFDLQTADPTEIRRARFGEDREFRVLIHAPSEAVADEPVAALDPDEARLLWFHTTERRVLSKPPDDEAESAAGRVLPVLAHRGPRAGEFAVSDTCPSCMQKDGIRFLGSAIATLLSVSLSTIFGSDELDKREKKALVFTDSVQDAAHRAGFVQSRSHSLTLRAVLRGAVPAGEVSLDELVERVLDQARDDPHRRYRILPPDVADRPEFEDFWRREASQVSAAVLRRVKLRLLLDIVLEFGLQSRLGRTLELTGTLAAEVDVPRATMLRAARDVEKAVGTERFEGLGATDEERITWVRGVLERMRTDGAIEHEWFHRYQAEDGRRYSIWGGRPRWNGMPAFPSGRGAPGYPRRGGDKPARHSDLVSIASPQSWYAVWTRRVLGCGTPNEGAALAAELLDALAGYDIVKTVNTDSGGRVYELAQSRVLVSRIDDESYEAGANELSCEVCRAIVPGTVRVIEELRGAPCLVARCGGRLRPSSGRPGNFYRRLYEASEITRVVAREHTSLLEDRQRLEYENKFKASAQDPQAPNVLVATPTLEMGIDIGDLSTVVLASLPKSVASYLQRVGRAGRLTGSALNLAFVSGRGEQLPRLGDPLSVINGEVRPPATYVDAEEILRRQYLASVADQLARAKDAPHPGSATQAIGTVDEGSFLRALIEHAEEPANAEEFLATFAGLSEQSRQGLRKWSAPAGDSCTSDLAQYLYTCGMRWKSDADALKHRVHEIEASLPGLEERAAVPAATEDDKVALRTAVAARRLVGKQLANLQGQFWISVLEEHGILPNYTLFDDSVTLDVTFSWIDPDTQDYMSEPATFNRGASTALREFAPGATFYARGYKIEVDALDLGIDGQAIQTWVFCPSCGYADQADKSRPTCPRCGETAIADAGQVLDVVELERVSSAMRREEAAIDDGRDERDRASFQIAIAADVDEPTKQWFAEGYPFGVKYLTAMTVRWLNLGRTSDPGASQLIAGAEYVAPQFRVCVGCGKLDFQTGQNSSAEHRPWCRYRNTTTENVRKLALGRTLRTEGVIVGLPPQLPVGDPFAIPSLIAALQAGLREHLGGSPDHLAFERLSSDGAANREAILIHDIVPGGTGYLAELADPEQFYELLHRSWTLVRDCPCKDEGRSSCHRCLSPYIHAATQKHVSRMAAERHLRTLLLKGATDGEPAPQLTWAVGEKAPAYDPETGIEQRFRKVLRERLVEGVGAVADVDGPNGVRWTINAAGGRTWVMEPQLALGGVKPDFVLRSNDQAIPSLAVFCDGWRWHASPAANRIADDATKREMLRQQGYAVIGVTWADLDAAESGTTLPPSWFSEARWTKAMQALGGDLKPGLRDLVVGGPIDYIVRWISQPDPAGFEALADALPLLLVGEGPTGKTSATDRLGGITRSLHKGDALGSEGERRTWAWSHDTLTVVSRNISDTGFATEIAALLDDRPHKLGQDHRAAWGEWLRIANLVNLRKHAARVTSYELTEVSQASTTDAGAELAGEWGALLRAAVTSEEKELIAALAAANSPLPDLGHETQSGLPLGVSWPDLLIAVEFDLTDEDRDELAEAGWTLVAPEFAAIEPVLAQAGGA